MERVTEKAYAKVNLTLDITGRRPDGYHDIESVMQTVSLCDTVVVSKSSEITVSCDDSELCGDSNLAYTAAKRFFEATGIDGGAKIEITKSIPKASGLGGGSSDAAAVLRALNRLYMTNLSDDKLIDIAVKIGADVPFLVFGGTKLCKGVGEKLETVSSLPECYIVIIKEGSKPSTGELYKRFDSEGADSRPDTQLMLSSLQNKDLTGVAANLCNVFEKSVPECEAIKSLFKDHGALGAVLSGSGPSVFGLFTDKPKALHFAQNCGKRAFLVTPINN